MALTPAQQASISAQLNAIAAQAASVQQSLNTLSTAQKAGMTITPQTTVAQAAAYQAPAAPAAAYQAPAAPATSASVSAPASTASTYKIASDDTLSGIASKYGTTISALMAANPSITNPNLIYAGNTLNIPKTTTPTPTPTPTPTTTTPPPTDLGTITDPGKTPTPFDQLSAVDKQAIYDALKAATGAEPSGSDYQKQMMDLITNLQTQNQSYLSALQNMPTAAQQYQTYREQLGLPASEVALSSTNVEIQKTQGLIDQLEKDINARISGKPITEPLRRRILATEQYPLAEQLGILSRTAGIQQTGVQSAKDQLVQLLNLAAQDQTRQAALAKAPLEMTQSLLPTISSLLQYQSPEEETSQQIAKEQLMKQLGLGTYAKAETTPQTIGGAGTGYYQYDSKTGTWKQVVSPAPETPMAGTPTSYDEWQLAGGQKGTGKTYNEWLSQKSAKTIPSNIITSLSGFDNSINSWTYVKQLAEEIKNEIGPTQILNYKGSIQNFARQYVNPKLSVLLAEVDKAFQLYRKETTGAQASDKELERLRPNLPAITESPAVFFSKIDATIAGTKRAQKALLDTLDKAGYDVSGYSLGETTQGTSTSLDALKAQTAGQNAIYLRSPSGEYKAFPNMSVEDLNQAIQQGWVRV